MPTWRDRARSIGLLVALTSAALALYANAIENPFVADDLLIIADNPTVTRPSAAGVTRLWVTDYQQGIDEQGRAVLDYDAAHGGAVYRPVAMFTFWLNAALTGVSPAAFRSVNVLLHAGAAYAVALLAWSYAGVLGALLAGGVMVLHPSATDVVNRVVGRADILAVLGVAAFLVVQGAAERDRWTWPRTVAAAFWAGVALGAKESGVVVIPLALLQAWIARAESPARTRTTPARVTATPVRRPAGIAWRPALAVALVVALYAAGRTVATGAKRFEREPTWDLLQNPLLGKALGERLPATASLALDYVRMVLVPWPLVAFDVADRVPTWSDASTWLGLAVLVAIVGCAVLLALRRRPLAIAFGWWLFGFGVVAQLLVPLVDYRQTRFVYALVPALALAVGLGVPGLRRRPARVAWVSAIALAGCLAAATVVARNRDFGSLRTLLEADARARPDSPATLLRLANLDAEEGESARAEAELARVTELAPASSQAWADRAAFYERAGRLDQARAYYDRALELNPSHYVAAMHLGTLAMDAGDLRAAERLLNQARDVAPDNPFVEYNLAVLDSRRGDVRAAIARLEDTVRRHPGFRLAADGLALLKSDGPTGAGR